ncbi:MAG: hypothetical protein HY064_13130 [Bacteroidetes bacterium]|nr:hypothetical protein [Bacteroidota bacterium]
MRTSRISARKILFIFIILFCLRSEAQNLPPHEHYITAGFNFGMFGWSPTKSYQAEGNDNFTRIFGGGIGLLSDVNGKTRLGVDANTSIGVNGGILFRDGNSKNFTGLQLDFQSNRACYEFLPPFRWTTSPVDSFSRWVMTDKYLKYSFSVQQCFFRNDVSVMGGESFFYIREGFGQTFYHRNFDQLIQQDHFEDWRYNQNGMTATTIAASKTSYMLSSEIGLRSFAGDHSRTFDIGIVFYAPFSATYTDQYEFFRNGVSSGKNNITYEGSTVMCNIRYSWDFKMKEHVRDTTEHHHKDLFVQQPDTASRVVEVQSTMRVHHDKVTVKLWDNDEIDGDSITLTLNGKTVKEHIDLKRRKKSFRIELDPGDNYLVMYAENLGTVPPNTAAVIIKDGWRKRRMALESDKGKSGAVKIVNGN